MQNTKARDDTSNIPLKYISDIFWKFTKKRSIFDNGIEKTLPFSHSFILCAVILTVLLQLTKRTLIIIYYASILFPLKIETLKNSRFEFSEAHTLITSFVFSTPIVAKNHRTGMGRRMPPSIWLWTD